MAQKSIDTSHKPGKPESANNLTVPRKSLWARPMMHVNNANVGDAIKTASTGGSEGSRPNSIDVQVDELCYRDWPAPPLRRRLRDLIILPRSVPADIKEDRFLTSTAMLDWDEALFGTQFEWPGPLLCSPGRGQMRRMRVQYQ
ncbi:MAG: hypothetical protein Q9163_000542 [Psora crenata]